MQAGAAHRSRGSRGDNDANTTSKREAYRRSDCAAMLWLRGRLQQLLAPVLPSERSDKHAGNSHSLADCRDPELRDRHPSRQNHGWASIGSMKSRHVTDATAKSPATVAPAKPRLAK